MLFRSWDCHGLPIEWKIEEQYRAKGKNKDEVPINEFRKECRDFAANWLNIQREEFKRLGVMGDWDHPYSTMAYPAEAQIAREIMQFAITDQLYRGSKPVMWSVVEKTSLAEAEIEYQDYQSDMVWVAFPVIGTPTPSASLEGEDFLLLQDAKVVIWTTTPWTIPGNRAICFGRKISYGLFIVEEQLADWAQPVGTKLLIATKLAAEVFEKGKLKARLVREYSGLDIKLNWFCSHPLASFDQRYGFKVPLLAGEHVADDAGTGFVHTAPGHGREDFDIWTSAGMSQRLQSDDIDPAIPYTVDGDSFYTADAPGFEGRRVIKENGDKGDANEAVIKALIDAGNLVARGRLKHQYPHSWRSKKPVIFRNTPQWFIHMDRKTPSLDGQTLREVSLQSIRETQWVPPSGENRITGMIEAKPDWVVSRQRAWGVPITVFVHRQTKAILKDERVNARIADAFEKEGGDAWFADGDGSRFLKPDYHPADYEKINDVLDVWFDSGSTHSYVLDDAKNFPGLADIKRKVAGGEDTVMYLEGSDQHRGWFHSSLIESSGTRGHAPYDVVLTHGFVLDEKGQKMSKSLGNVVAPQDVIKNSGADILRLWVAASDYSDDLRIGPDILKNFMESYRKLRNSLRWMLGALAHFETGDTVANTDMPELEQLMLHKLAELDGPIRQAYSAYDYRRVVTLLSQFMNVELSSFYFDIRKDTLYCEAPSSHKRKAALTAIDIICDAMIKWLAPILVYTADEAWTQFRPNSAGNGEDCVHLHGFPDISQSWINADLAKRWAVIRNVRRAVTGALELERVQKRIGSSLEAAPHVHVQMEPWAMEALRACDFADICITSGITIAESKGPDDAFRLDDLMNVAVVFSRAEGTKCARSWRYTRDVGSDPAFPDVSARDAQALHELRTLGRV